MKKLIIIYLIGCLISVLMTIRIVKNHKEYTKERRKLNIDEEDYPTKRDLIFLYLICSLSYLTIIFFLIGDYYGDMNHFNLKRK